MIYELIGFKWEYKNIMINFFLRKKIYKINVLLTELIK